VVRIHIGCLSLPTLGTNKNKAGSTLAPSIDKATAGLLRTLKPGKGRHRIFSLFFLFLFGLSGLTIQTLDSLAVFPPDNQPFDIDKEGGLVM
jgi:hypothetical protein